MATRVISGVEELKTLIGQEVGVSDLFEVTQTHINNFADATEDHQWIHVDPERARTESPFGATIAHGFLTLSLLPHFAAQALKRADTAHVLETGEIVKSGTGAELANDDSVRAAYLGGDV